MNQHNVSLFFSLVQKNNDARLIGLVRPPPPKKIDLFEEPCGSIS